jgi:hypothetical protein
MRQFYGLNSFSTKWIQADNCSDLLSGLFSSIRIEKRPSQGWRGRGMHNNLPVHTISCIRFICGSLSFICHEHYLIQWKYFNWSEQLSLHLKVSWDARFLVRFIFLQSSLTNLPIRRSNSLSMLWSLNRRQNKACPNGYQSIQYKYECICDGVQIKCS